MILEVLLYGLGLFWLLGLVPAAAICALKGCWSYFWVGWISLGLGWFIGAFAQDPERPRERSRVIGLALAAAAVVLVLGLLGARPTPILGIDGAALQSSLGSTGIPKEGNSCERKGGGNWMCLRHDEEFSGTVPYRVHVNGLGCWHAKLLVRPDSETGPENLSGCIGLLDYVFNGGGTD
jgi:hypothetical protein